MTLEQEKQVLMNAIELIRNATFNVNGEMLMKVAGSIQELAVLIDEKQKAAAAPAATQEFPG